MKDLKGFLLIDKESGVTSFDVVREIRKACGVKRVGHAGTLDPLATGLLLVAVGEATKLLEFLVGCDKAYEVVARFGAVSDTYDADGRIAKGDSLPQFSREDLEVAVQKHFSGSIMQIPPKFSALKVGGRKAYELARAGEEVELVARNVRIDEFAILDFDWPVVKFSVKCSTGTYIRSLVHDLGQVLGCGAYVVELRRTKVGSFDLGDAVVCDVAIKNVEQNLLSMEKVAKMFEFWDLTDGEMGALSDGRVLLGKKIEHQDFVMAFHDGRLVGVLENFREGVKFRKLIL